MLDVVGGLAFSMSGRLVAIRRRMDIVGVIALAVVIGFGDGIARRIGRRRAATVGLCRQRRRAP